MGTKNNPGNFDCYDKLDPDEPMFVLMGRDPQAGYIVRCWAEDRVRKIAADRDGGVISSVQYELEMNKVLEAYKCADDMDAWCRHMGKEPRFRGD